VWTTAQKTHPLLSNGCSLLSRIVRITQLQAVYRESVSMGTCLSSRCLSIGRYVTILFPNTEDGAMSFHRNIGSSDIKYASQNNLILIPINILYRVGGIVRVYRLSHSIFHTLFSTLPSMLQSLCYNSRPVELSTLTLWRPADHSLVTLQSLIIILL
jgi:hypothetical protein